MTYYDEMKAILDRYGLGSLAQRLLEFSQQGYDDSTISLKLQDTPEYKQRFAGNEARRKAGLGVLSPGEYLSLEASYRQILSSAGMPAGFYDSPDDFTKWISDDVAPQEIQGRVQFAQRYVANSDPSVKQALQSYYGIGDAELVAYALDRTRAVPLLEKQAQAIELGAAANAQGLALSRERAEMFADRGAAGNARQAFGAIAEILPDAQRLSDIYGGEDVTQTDLEDEALGGLASAARKRKKLVEQEQGSFSGNGGASRSSFGKSTAGSY